MEITSNTPQLYTPRKPQADRADEYVPYRPQSPQQGEQGRGADNPRQTPVTSDNAEQLDYRQLLQQARLRGIRDGEQQPPQREAYRQAELPTKVRQALGSYSDNAQLHEGVGELLPRLDSYV